jgi:hypothetical protein
MAELGAETRTRIDELRPLMAAFVAERGLTDYVKVCNYVPVAIGLRPLSLTYLPAELPGGQRMGEAIDRYFSEHYSPPAGAGPMSLFRRKGSGGQGPDPERELLAKRRTLDDAYSKIVAESQTYITHLSWLDKVGLDQYQVKRRPSLREMYVYRDRAVREQLLAVETIAEEARLRVAAARGKDREQALIEYVYANEFEPRYLRGLGRLLGYPECCVEAYARDRESARSVEQRAWEQVRDKHAASEHIDIHAYYLKDFFPCQPDCPKAVELGELFEQACAELHPELGEVYTGVMWSNFDLIQNYPQLIAQHRHRLEQSRR